MENLDTDIPPPADAMEATRAAIGEDEANSWLPFTGRDDLAARQRTLSPGAM
jgi:N-succinyldiaminopimelate aminotransferase